MIRIMKRWTALLLVMLLLPLAALAEATTPPETNADGKPYVLNEFKDTNLDLTQYAGKAIWLNFFTGWCQYCMEEMPYIKQTFDAYDPDQVAIVLVHVWDGETAADSASVVEKFGLQDMTLVEDENMELAGLIGLQGYPTSLFIDKEGYLLGGAYGLTYDQMASYMDQLSVGKRPTATVTPQ